MDEIKDIYFHGTSRIVAQDILHSGFKLGWYTDDKNAEKYFRGGNGNIGFGAYLSSDWRISLFFGPALIRVHLSPGTRILRISPKPNEQILRYLRQEFGRTILDPIPLHKILPKNKKLTLREYTALLHYHYYMTQKYFWAPKSDLTEKRYARKWKYVESMHRLGRGLKRFGFHGFGDPTTHNGLVIFEPHRIIAEDIAATVPQSTWDQFLQQDAFKKLRSLDDLQSTASLLL
jgi:hypothetical protein